MQYLQLNVKVNLHISASPNNGSFNGQNFVKQTPMVFFLRRLAIFIAIEPLYGQLTTLTGTGGSLALTDDDVLPTGTQATYLTFNSTITLSSTTGTDTSVATTIIAGGTAASNSTTKSSATKTSSSTTPSNTQPCNNYVEFCTRKYSNITMVTAHNFPFVKKGNAESNQDYGVTDQLNDGIRMRSYGLFIT
jgi:hypothetical protein